MPEQELDVRALPKPQKHPAIFGAFAALAPGEAVVLVNDHDPQPLRGEFEADFPGGFSWEYLAEGPREWRVRIGRLHSTPLPRILCDTGDLGDDPDAAGAVWALPVRDRDLDSNVIQLPAGRKIDAHAGPDLDVLIHVLRGTGTLRTEGGDVPLAPGVLLWLPKRSRREFLAGESGLRYLTVHQRRKALTIEGLTHSDR
ncbi:MULTISPECIES: DUF2249 domain-containing protein [unclassified Saccharopolyspora]|uniref:DUF2249 domain-containing protein n=1 Tax=unclassified Saccharopolyspora TaxID=2646250 RepID=UPI001CD1A529|nr:MULTISPECIES: DUF2249 domain-containing protein [unclassified Saccharopolyspora]MCA1189098.1 DUF2249 domain-containing protein [Saccharopolyspora sp. 6T]MCA1283252.1 DUF2249 domain-containing protein [Saccharopolyspora sp. 7B]